ncbi:hypothetical protein [Burkholderia cenocepacia]|uniref:hypothetical protein n=1 Tax=Burkholderia cenocepacia TaxID=95486 RepID=UPI0007620240|nr:hypothetical protein [Burkholderia cenocepacia]KWU23367.1 hypothetical protein AS149_37490 [Burkholderia cenocepacia]
MTATTESGTHAVAPTELDVALELNAQAIQEARAHLARLDSQRATLLARTPVKCTHNFIYGQGCGATFEIGKLEYRQVHRYESPHGCSGGDIWHPTEGNFICPSCGHRNRLYDRKAVDGLRAHFKNIVNDYPQR